MADSARRSTRQRKTNPRYSNDGWDKGTLRLLRASSESSGSSQVGSEESDLVSENVEFTADHRTLQNDNEEYEEVGRSAVPTEAELSDSPTFGSSDEDAMDATLAIGCETTGQGLKRRLHVSRVNESRSRGLGLPNKKGRKSQIYSGMFGPGVDDVVDALEARDTWLNARDSTLPSRCSLSAVAKNSSEAENSRSRTQAPQKQARLDERNTPFDERVLDQLDTERTGRRYLPKEKLPHSVILGVWTKQRMLSVSQGSPYDLGNAWSRSSLSPPNSGDQNRESSLDSHYQGWLLNIGEKLECMAWAPTRCAAQYLAIATRCTSEQRYKEPFEEPRRPAFHQSPTYPATVQIWSFKTITTTSKGVRTLDYSEKPALAAVCGTEWGNIRELKWRPITPDKGSHCAEFPLAEGVPQCNSPHVSIGDLAAIFSDGIARIFDVKAPRDGTGQSKAVKRLVSPKYSFTPTLATKYTALGFASWDDLILGTSDGSIHVYSLCAGSMAGDTVQYASCQPHHTYIVSIAPASAYHPSLIASVSAIGDLTLTDLRSAPQDSVTSVRACFPNRSLYYSPFTRSFITLIDRIGNTKIETNSSTFMYCNHVRQFHTSLRVAKLPDHGGGGTVLAGSQHHPCLLAGNAQGTVFATNYLRKVMMHKQGSGQAAHGAYLQKICEYEWRPLSREKLGRPVETWDKTKEIIDIYHGDGIRPGVSRFHQGFKPERIEVAGPSGVKGGSKTANTKREASTGEAIYDEEQAVTTLDWNPNLDCAGFAAMGWGSGIVRVQDLAHDVR